MMNFVLKNDDVFVFLKNKKLCNTKRWILYFKMMDLGSCS